MIYSSVPTVDLRLDSPRETQNWRPLLNWLFAIPHLIIANALGNVANLLSVISWFSIVFTGHMPEGIAHVAATFNNTIIAISDMEGNILAWSSAGANAFRGSKKGTSFAAQVAAGNAARLARDHGIRAVEVRVKGPGAGLFSAPAPKSEPKNLKESDK